jgi:hypothetical protein
LENHTKCKECKTYGIKELIKLNPDMLEKV